MDYEKWSVIESKEVRNFKEEPVVLRYPSSENKLDRRIPVVRPKDATSFECLLLQFIGIRVPMLSMLEWLCSKLMEAEVSQQLGAEKHAQSASRSSSRSGYRPRSLDTRTGSLYLLVPKVRKGGYIPFFVTERKRSEAGLIQVIQEAYINGVSTRKIEKLAQSLGIEGLS